MFTEFVLKSTGKLFLLANRLIQSVSISDEGDTLIWIDLEKGVSYVVLDRYDDVAEALLA